MSRVFEALVKAGEEKKRKGVESNGESEKLLDLTAVGESQGYNDPRWLLAGNGKASDGAHPVSRPITKKNMAGKTGGIALWLGSSSLCKLPFDRS